MMCQGGIILGEAQRKIFLRSTAQDFLQELTQHIKPAGQIKRAEPALDIGYQRLFYSKHIDVILSIVIVQMCSSSRRQL